MMSILGCSAERAGQRAEGAGLLGRAPQGRARRRPRQIGPRGPPASAPSATNGADVACGERRSRRRGGGTCTEEAEPPAEAVADRPPNLPSPLRRRGGRNRSLRRTPPVTPPSPALQAASGAMGGDLAARRKGRAFEAGPSGSEQQRASVRKDAARRAPSAQSRRAQPARSGPGAAGNEPAPQHAKDGGPGGRERRASGPASAQDRPRVRPARFAAQAERPPSIPIRRLRR